MPEEPDFITLKPGESHSVQAEYGVRRRGGSAVGGLAPGQYYLQVMVATWPYFVESREYREKWRRNGYVWSQNIKSQPMLFSLQ